MTYSLRTAWIPLCSFALAVALAMLTGSSSVSAHRRPSGPTNNCTHTFSKKRTPPRCISFETAGGGELEESDCQVRPATDVPGISREIRLLQLVENDTKTPAGDPVDESEANTSAGGRDGGLVLGLGGQHQIQKTLQRVTGDNACCHAIDIDGNMSVSTQVYLDDPVVRGNTAFAIARSRGTVELKPDCGAAGSTTVVDVTLVAVRRRTFMGELEDQAYYFVVQNGTVDGPKDLPFPDASLGGGTNKSVTPEIKPIAGAGVSATATARFEGQHRVSVQAALVNNKVGDARGRTRLKSLTLYDRVDTAGEAP